MAKDYAKRGFLTSRPRQKSRVRVEFFVVSIIVVLCLLTATIFLHKTNTKNLSFLARVKIWFSHPAHQSVESNKLNQPPPHIPPSVHFDFYNQLPNMQVKVSKTDTQPAPISKETPLVAKPTLSAPQYVLLIGEYKDMSSASQARLSVLLAGSEAVIEKRKNNDAEVYRLQRGPFDTAAEAKKIQKQLAKKGIETQLTKS